jgi:uncharacterized protein (TIGR02678 family)
MPLRHLLAGVRTAARDAGIAVPDAAPGSGVHPVSPGERAALAAALQILTDHQVIALADGSPADAYDGPLLDSAERAEASGPGEVLLTVDREIARALVAAGPLAAASDAGDLVRRATEPTPVGGGRGVAVRRRLAETPAVLLDELTDDEREWLRGREHQEAEEFADFLGLQAEIRAEGMALFDPAGELSDLDFPGTGPLAQAALLLIERLVEQLRPVPCDRASQTAGEPVTGVPVTGVPVPDAAIDGVLGDIVDEYGRRAHWCADYLSDRTAFRRDVLHLLHRMHLIAPSCPARAGRGGAREPRCGARGTASGGWVLLAVASRYAPQAAPYDRAASGRHARRARQPGQQEGTLPLWQTEPMPAGEAPADGGGEGSGGARPLALSGA